MKKAAACQQPHLSSPPKAKTFYSSKVHNNPVNEDANGENGGVLEGGCEQQELRPPIPSSQIFLRQNSTLPVKTVFDFDHLTSVGSTQAPGKLANNKF